MPTRLSLLYLTQFRLRKVAATRAESGGAIGLDVLSAVEAALLVEMVMDRGMNGREFLQRSHLPEPLHCPFSARVEYDARRLRCGRRRKLAGEGRVGRAFSATTAPQTLQDKCSLTYTDGSLYPSCL